MLVVRNLFTRTRSVAVEQLLFTSVKTDIVTSSFVITGMDGKRIILVQEYGMQGYEEFVDELRRLSVLLPDHLCFPAAD